MTFFFTLQITLVIGDLNYEKRVGKQNKVRQHRGPVKRKKKKKDFDL